MTPVNKKAKKKTDASQPVADYNQQKSIALKGNAPVIPLPAYDLERVRDAFPISQKIVYLNHASISPLPLPVQQAMQTAVERLGGDPLSFFSPNNDDPLGNIFVKFNKAVAGLINAAHPHEIVGVTSTSTGLNAVAQAIQWQPGDNIVLAGVEFPSNAYPWMVLDRFGVECRIVPPPCPGASVAAFEPLVDGRTRLITVSAVQFLTGHRADLAALGAFCRAHGILFAVDAIQAAGHIPIDVQAMQIDILASGSQKSLMSAPGQGFLYVRDEVSEAMKPGIVGPNAVEGYEHWAKYDLTPAKGAQRFLMGTTNIVGMVALIESIHFLQNLGLTNIDAWTQHLSHLVIEDVSARGYTVITPDDQLGPIVTFRIGHPEDREAAEAQANALLAHLTANGVRVTKHWDVDKNPHLRISTHCYNTEEEVRRAGALLGSNEP
jgi:cysteine desulfurase/selenocysteine lyase